MATEDTSISEASIGEKLKTSSALQAQHVVGTNSGMIFKSLVDQSSNSLVLNATIR